MTAFRYAPVCGSGSVSAFQLILTILWIFGRLFVLIPCHFLSVHVLAVMYVAHRMVGIGKACTYTYTSVKVPYVLSRYCGVARAVSHTRFCRRLAADRILPCSWCRWRPGLTPRAAPSEGPLRSAPIHAACPTWRRRKVICYSIVRDVFWSCWKIDQIVSFKNDTWNQKVLWLGISCHHIKKTLLINYQSDAIARN